MPAPAEAGSASSLMKLTRRSFFGILGTAVAAVLWPRRRAAAEPATFTAEMHFDPLDDVSFIIDEEGDEDVTITWPDGSESNFKARRVVPDRTPADRVGMHFGRVSGFAPKITNVDDVFQTPTYHSSLITHH